jgi:hypothetical protein
MLGRYNNYEENVTIVKQYGDYKLKVVNLSYCRISGCELDTPKKKNSVNTLKLSNNIIRAKTKVQELAFCNDWNYFVTLTIDKKKYDRYDLKTYYHDFSEFLHNLNRRRTVDNKIVYLLIPEMHKDGAWHIHGLFNGLQPTDLYINQNGYLGWLEYEKRFGYISFSKVKDKDRVSNYIVKYLTKDVDKNVSELGLHLYYASKGLQKADVLFRGRAELLCPWDYEHPDHYCRVKTFDLRTDDYTDYLKLE